MKQHQHLTIWLSEEGCGLQCDRTARRLKIVLIFPFYSSANSWQSEFCQGAPPVLQPDLGLIWTKLRQSIMVQIETLGRKHGRQAGHSHILLLQSLFWRSSRTRRFRRRQKNWGDFFSPMEVSQSTSCLSSPSPPWHLYVNILFLLAGLRCWYENYF